mmetsp:Transcript_11623/g.13143  ORF Transcript_11623/g.13143 Transcript_11623/m.13143 type:complete len:164 (-) Transcript_11623:22-513(-)
MPRKYTRKENFANESLEVLEKWIESHKDFPYPTNEDLEYLSSITGLRTKQIRIWCTNTRKRKLNITREMYLLKHNKKPRNHGSKKNETQKLRLKKMDELSRFDYNCPPTFETEGHHPTMFTYSPYTKTVEVNQNSMTELEKYVESLGYCPCSLNFPQTQFNFY